VLEHKFKSFLDKNFGYSGPILVTGILFFLSGFSLGLFERRSIWVLMLIVLFSLWRGRFFSWATFKKAAPYILFFGVHLLFMGNTSNTNAGWVDVQSKLLLVILPWCVFCWDRSKIVLHASIWGLGIGAVVRLFIGFVIGVPDFISSGGSTVSITYTNLSMGIHPTYIGMYLILFQLFLIGKLKNGKAKRHVWPWFIIASIFTALLSSKMTLGAEIGVFITALYYVWKYQRRSKGHWGVFGLASVLFLVSLLQNPLMSSRLNSFISKNAQISQVTTIENQPKVASQGSHRVHIWKSAWEVVKQNPIFGVGTGDVNGELKNAFAQNGYTIGVERGYNAHNTYLQILCSFGIIGMAVFAFLFFKVFSTFRQKRPTWKYAFFFLLLCFLLIESMFERQGGLLFFCLFLPLLSAPSLDK
jgi:O-antigen ligase